MDLYPLLRGILFRLDAERAHELTFSLAKQAWVRALMPRTRVNPDLACTHFGLHFRNPLGLAAGMDKNAELLEVWQRLGFGFVEVGTVTPRPQPGNPKPRLFRLPQDRALINRLGFNNHGAEAMARQLEHRPAGLVVGVNLGKNKDTPNEDAHLDYVSAFTTLSTHGDYFVVNVSSPNTPGLRELQEGPALKRILGELQQLNQRLATPRPLLLKIAPDLSDHQLDEVIAVARVTQLSGLVATNTTLSRSGLRTNENIVSSFGAGGLSGAPLHDRSTAVIRYLTSAGLPVIGVGGITDAASAHSTLAAGARLLQVYTGLVYRGPALIPELLAAISQDMNREVCTVDAG
jgi:dihydroorotate dehydrogenase